ncbi:peptidyl-prolyl cis-trans isomerase, partial [Candidatus Dependentiae bacterium]|nr:peptidyl-prolyl cis-trans isomerase [Candidatus Dependentiae bacterium]
TEEFNYRIHKRFHAEIEDKDKLLKTLKTQLIILEFMKRKFSNISFTKKELREYYNQNSDSFYEPDEASVMQIFVLTENLASEIHAQLKKGKKFEVMAKEFNEHPYKENAGSIQTYRKGELPQEFEVVVFKLRRGKFSKVVKSNYGFHIFKLKSKKMARVVEFKEAENMIRNKLTEQAIEKKFKIWITKERSKFDIKINHKYLEK